MWVCVCVRVNVYTRIRVLYACRPYNSIGLVAYVYTTLVRVYMCYTCITIVYGRRGKNKNLILIMSQISRDAHS